MAEKLSSRGQSPGELGVSSERHHSGEYCKACGRAFDTDSHEEFERRKRLLARLSESQIQVLGYLLMGHTEPAIAETLHRSRHTVHDHTKAIYATCGVTRRVHLVQSFRGIPPEDLIGGRIPEYLQ